MCVAVVIVHLCDNYWVAMANVVNVALTVAVDVLRALDEMTQVLVLGTMVLDYKNVDLHHLSEKYSKHNSMSLDGVPHMLFILLI